MSTNPLTRNVTRVYRDASDAQRAHGAVWYVDAFTIADSLAVRHSIPTASAAGIIAALSPLNSWGANLNLAARFIAAGGMDSGYLSIGLRKANAILAGTDPLDVLKSDKVRNFYLAIASQGVEGVCVDRHAWAITVAERGADAHLSAKRYAAAAETYRRAARILSREAGQSLTAAQVQAATWVAWRSRFWSEGAWDKHDVA